MKRSFFRVMAMVLSLVMLITALYVSPMTASATETTATASDAPVLAYVPLDDRPVVTDRVQYAATAAGFDIQMPNYDLIRTRLDNQGTNISNGKPYGDGRAIMDWLIEMDQNGCDYFIVHLDMLYSGGLVNSRYPDDSNVTSVETGILDDLIPLTNDLENHFYFLDTVMRLASTSRYKNYGSAEYSAIRNYAEKSRYVMADEEFDLSAYTGVNESYAKTVEIINTIKSYYQTDESGNAITYDTSVLDQSELDQYHNNRYRKMQLFNLTVHYANRNVKYIFGVDDASPKTTIQSNEIKLIRSCMSKLGYDYYLFADTDSMGLMGLARCVADYYGDQPTVRVRYYGERKDDPADQYDIGTLDENVESHLQCTNATVVTDTASKADVELLILTRIGAQGSQSDPDRELYDVYDKKFSVTEEEKADYNNNIIALCEQAQSNIDANIPTIVLDASLVSKKAFLYRDNGFLNLQDELLARVEISRLVGYSNWNTVGNTLGIGLGQGISRYVYLANEENITADSHIAAIQSITYSYVKDIAYNLRHKNADYSWMFHNWMNSWVNANGSDSLNFYPQMINYSSSVTKEDWETSSGEAYLNNKLQEMMAAGGIDSLKSDSYVEIIDVLESGSIYTSLGEIIQTEEIDIIELNRFRYPWYRTFEITFNIDVVWNESYTRSGNYIVDIPQKLLATKFVSNAEFDFTTEQPSFQNVAGPLTYLAPAQVTVTHVDGTAVADTDLVGTGYQVSVTQNGTTTTYEAVVQGDIVGKSASAEGDGAINTADARQVLRYVVGAAELTQAQMEAANMDDSGSIGSNDARRILQQALGM